MLQAPGAFVVSAALTDRRNYIVVALVRQLKRYRLRVISIQEYYAYMPKGLTTQEAADRLGVTPGRIRHMVLAGRLPAERFGRSLVFRESDLDRLRDRKPGRPPGKKRPSRKS